MKVAVSSMGSELRSEIDPRFGRASYLLIVDTDTMESEWIQNPNIAAAGGAGIQTAQMIADKGAQVVLTGNCGPNAFNALSAAGIEVIAGVSGTVEDAVNAYKQGRLQSTSGPSVASHSGMSGMNASSQATMSTGMGQGAAGSGGGMGRGMRRGGGFGRRGVGSVSGWRRTDTGYSPGATGSAQPMSTNPQAELQMLKQQAEMLKEQLDQIHQSISELERSNTDS